jgi:7-cyano-7-deazaguanine synthase
MSKFDGLLMASGGLDSTVLAYKLLSEGKNIIPLFINYGQHFHKTEEERFLEVLPPKFIKNYQKIDVSDVFKNSHSIMVKKIDLTKEKATDNDVFLPYRNMYLLSSAIAFASSISVKDVYSAFINSNHAKEIDATSNFLDYISNYFQTIGDVKLHMPLRNMTKTEVLKLGINLASPVERTFSCQVYEHVHCGACANCVDRQNAFNEVIASERNSKS